MIHPSNLPWLLSIQFYLWVERKAEESVAFSIPRMSSNAKELRKNRYYEEVTHYVDTSDPSHMRAALELRNMMFGVDISLKMPLCYRLYDGDLIADSEVPSLIQELEVRSLPWKINQFSDHLLGRILSSCARKHYRGGNENLLRCFPPLRPGTSKVAAPLGSTRRHFGMLASIDSRCDSSSGNSGAKGSTLWPGTLGSSNLGTSAPLSRWQGLC